MHQILCSSGALIGRPNGRDFHLLETYCPQLNCDGFEFILYDSWYPQISELTAFLRSLNLHIPVMHCEKTVAESITRGGKEEEAEAFRCFRINCELARNIGSEKLVLHLWNGLISDDHFENNLRAYPAFREIATEYGLVLLVENVICHGSPMEHWKELYQCYPDILFVYDTKMADFHREMDLLYDPDYAWLWQENHIRHYHVNDYGGGYRDWDNLRVLAPGKGHIDFTRFFDFVQKTKYTGDFTFEATGFDKTGKVDIPMLNRQFEYARNELNKRRENK